MSYSGQKDYFFEVIALRQKPYFLYLLYMHSLCTEMRPQEHELKPARFMIFIFPRGRHLILHL